VADRHDPPHGLPALATNFGGGGGFGFGFDMGVADGLRRAGIDVTDYPMIGTSAGSHTVAALRLGIGFHDFADQWADQIGEGTGRPWSDGYAFADRMYRDVHDPDVAAVAVRMARARREVLNSADHGIDDIVAASSAAAPVIRPHKVDGHWYTDGGAISLNSVDLTPAAQLGLVVTPFARRGQGIAGVLGRSQVPREIRRWVGEHGGDLLWVVPTDAMVAIGGKRIRDIVDIEIGRAVYPLAVEHGERVAAELRSMRPDLFA
jgi:predicted acylesterase/phospholipase RssA